MTWTTERPTNGGMMIQRYILVYPAAPKEIKNKHITQLPPGTEIVTYDDHKLIAIKKDQEKVNLERAVGRFLEQANQYPPWEQAGGLWASAVKELHTVWLDCKGVPTLHKSEANGQGPLEPDEPTEG